MRVDLLRLTFAVLGIVGLTGAAESLPVTPAETLSGHKVDFPTALAGKTAVVVFGFSKEAGDGTKVWMARLSQDGMNAWSVANLEKAPALVRGMIRSSMRKGTPAGQLDHSLILTKDEKRWAQVVGVRQESQPVVVLLDPTGKIVWTVEGAFSEQSYQELRTKLATVDTR